MDNSVGLNLSVNEFKIKILATSDSDYLKTNITILILNTHKLPSLSRQYSNKVIYTFYIPHCIR